MVIIITDDVIKFNLNNLNFTNVAAEESLAKFLQFYKYLNFFHLIFTLPTINRNGNLFQKKTKNYFF